MRWDYAYILLVFLLICTPVGAECPPLRIDLNDLSLREGDTLLRDLGPDGVIYSVAYVNSTITNIGLNSRTGIINFTPEKKHKGEHTLAFVAVQGTCISSKLITLVVKVRPKILIFEPEQEHIVLQEGMFKRFYAEADGANLAYSWYVDNDYKDIGQEFMFTPNYYDSGSHEIRLEVKDAQDLSSIITWTVNVSNVNRPPIQIYLLSDYRMFENDFGTPYDLNVYFIDPDDDPLEFEYRFLHERDVRPNDPFMDVTIVEGKVTIESKQGYKGIKSLRFTATDPSGEVAKSNAVLIGVAEKKIMCGDGLCYEENCTTCPTDCGRCDTCQEKWICGNWSNCNFGQMQTRLCKDLSDCKTSKDKPDLTRKCPYTCHDSIMNQDETSVDCGGVCKECPTCWDGKTNGNESGKDCGGECKACPAGAKCNTHLDCDSYVCAGSGICQAASCSDQTKNQGEQGIDCGPVCGNVCPSCFDEIKNQDEKGIDCGGSCEACATCSDHIKNQNEIKADCGGPCRVCTFEELYGISPKAIIVFLIMLLLFATLLAILERRYNFIFKSIGMNMSIDSLLFFNKFTSLFYFGKGKRQGVTEETIHNLKMLDSAEKGLDEKFLELLNGYYMTVFQVHDTFTHEQLYFKLKEYKMPDTARQLVILCYDTVQQYEKRKYRTHVEAHMLVHQAIKVLDAVKRYV